MHKFYKLLSFLSLTFISTTIFAQTNIANASNNDGAMRSGGKIYVVMAIVITILTGLIIYVYRLDRKISRIEKDNV